MFVFLSNVPYIMLQNVSVSRRYIQTFGYDREEVTRVMNTFKDPTGLICKEKKNVSINFSLFY